MTKVAVVGVGKMGLSHLSMLRAHPNVELVGVCDSVKYVLDVLEKYTGIKTFTDYDTMLAQSGAETVVIATPTATHFPMAEKAIKQGLNVFCEKPLTLSLAESTHLAELAAQHGVVTQVGYHNRFVGAFTEVKRLLDAGAIGKVSHALAESYGPVVLAPKGGTWRNRRETGGGCLYDYAAHTIDLVNWYMGTPSGVSGTIFGSVFSAQTEDEVYGTLNYADGRSAQLSVDWSDESYRKMTTKVTLWGEAGRITVDRQECQVYLRDTAIVPEGYVQGWNVRYTTELTQPTWFYLRGEEYSSELDYFIGSVSEGEDNPASHQNSFASATEADKVIDMLIRDAATKPAPSEQLAALSPLAANPKFSWRRLASLSKLLGS
ncbi:Gfo/Idh/MocA family protein [Arthrobacter sp. HLT1-20]